MKRENIKTSKYLCIGCGACSYACKKQSISFTENTIGQYIPILDTNSCVNCGLCLDNCPINGASIPPITAPNSNNVTGDYAKCYMGYDPRFRKTSASGGLLTSYLYYLLKSHVVKTVVCVASSKNASGFYKHAYVDNPEELILYSKSAYYPLQIDEVLDYIKKNDGTYAIVVLPCQAKAIRLLQRHDRILKERIRLLLGLVCGGLPGKSLVEYVCGCKGHSTVDVDAITFREKEKNHKAENCSIKYLRNNKLESSYFHNDHFGFAFLNRLFTNPACNICNDAFAEYADAVFMDAWLKEYKPNVYGTSICITRSSLAEDAAAKCFSSIAEVSVVDVSIPILAQTNVYVVQRKKKQNYVNRYLYKLKGYKIETFGTGCKSFIEKLKYIIKGLQNILIEHYSFKYWSQYKEGYINAKQYDLKIRGIIHKVKLK